MSFHFNHVKSEHPIKIPGKLRKGKQIVIKGRLDDDADRFYINLQCDNEEECDIPLHFNPRQSDDEVVRNTYMDGSWGDEEKHHDRYPFKDGHEFVVRIVVEDDEYKVYVNNRPFVDYKHRASYKSARYIKCGGDAKFFSITCIARLKDPYKGKFPEKLREGAAVRVRGRVTGERFSINLTGSKDTDTTAYHFNPRNDGKDVVRNAKLSGEWGDEETHCDCFPFDEGDFFDVLIIVTDHSYLTYVNDKYFCHFNHRCSYDDVKNLMVEGAAVVGNVEFFVPMEEDHHPIVIPSGLKKNDNIIIKGFFKHGGDRFCINFLNGHDRDDDIAFHVNPRREQGEVVMNSREGGDWKEEETKDLPDDLKDVKPFTIRVRAKPSEFEVFVNDHYVDDFSARGDILDEVKAITVGGDAYFYEVKVLRRVDKPYIEKLPNNLRHNGWISVSGLVKKHPERFSVNMTCGHDDDSDIAFHFNPRISDEQVVRNSMVDGDWNDEETDSPDFPFHKKQLFEILINSDDDSFWAYVNGKKFIKFDHRIPVERVCHLKLEGDVNFFPPEFF